MSLRTIKCMSQTFVSHILMKNLEVSEFNFRYFPILEEAVANSKSMVLKLFGNKTSFAVNLTQLLHFIRH